MNVPLMSIVGVVALVITGVVAGRKWGVTVGALGAMISGIATITATNKFAPSDCSWYTDVATKSACLANRPSWFALHSDYVIGIAVTGAFVIALVWLVPVAVKAAKAA